MTVATGLTKSIASAEQPTIVVTDWREQGLPVLFVHGFSHNRHVWDDLAPALSGGYRPLALDLRGHGDSGWSKGGHYSVFDYASDLARVLDGMEIERAVVVGHSLGGNASTLFAAQYPERVERLVLVDTGPSLSLDAMIHMARDVSGALQSYASLGEYRQTLVSTYPLGTAATLDRMASLGLVERIDGRFEPRLDPGILTPSTDPAHWTSLEQKLWSALRKIRCKTLVVRGGVSAMLAEKVAVEMVDGALRDAVLATVPNAGHAIMVDDGPALLGVIEGFLATPA